MTRVIVATRSTHKLRELREILPPIDGLELADLTQAAVPEDPAEEAIETHSTFGENALAKARYFSALTGAAVLADDSGLSVDALDGAPGVCSRRYSGRDDLSGRDLDRANIDALLEALRTTPREQRTARFHCAIALVEPTGTEHVVHGELEGVILSAPRGDGGFGYDPLFFVPEMGCTLAEVPAERKNAISHRSRAVREVVPYLRNLAGSALP